MEVQNAVMAGLATRFGRAATDAVGCAPPERPAVAGTRTTAGLDDGAESERTEEDWKSEVHPSFVPLPCLLMRKVSNEKPPMEEPVWIKLSEETDRGVQLVSVSDQIETGVNEAISRPQRNSTSGGDVLLPGLPLEPSYAAPTDFAVPPTPPPPTFAAPNFGLPASPPPPSTAAALQVCSPQDDMALPTENSTGTSGQRRPCKYGEECYKKNELHVKGETENGPCHSITWTIRGCKLKKHALHSKELQMSSPPFTIDLVENDEVKPIEFMIFLRSVAMKQGKGAGGFKYASEGKISLKCKQENLSSTLPECNVTFSCDCNSRDLQPKAVQHNFTEKPFLIPDEEGKVNLTTARELDTINIEVKIAPLTQNT